MAMSFSTASREVLEQVVREPRFRALTQIPLLAPMEIGLVWRKGHVFTSAETRLVEYIEAAAG